MPNVILLRSPAESQPDPYESTLLAASLNPYSIPALETSFTHLSDLQSLVSLGPQAKDYAGVIITSKRSCEAWTTAAKNQLASLSPNDVSRSELKASLVAWTKVPFYVVGKGTAAALEEFRELCLESGVNSTLDIRGQETGTGEQLAHFILEDIRGDRDSNNLLYLTGDKNRDTVSKILSSEEAKASNITLHTLQVYETHDNIWWFVFFAPSSSQFAYPMLSEHFQFIPKDSPSVSNATSALPIARVAAIGRVTSAFLEEELKVRVDAIAAKPSPEALAAAISSAME
ncbi:hypothetical protein D9756_007891 [Leucocoprinus leucothites]|uniref:Tetrapyrrole biosynthesis uroporphyrinogen III synthase domain-containing protein n=1 Tax=Leucocoprinus leucothites TaxID=201217 RepID=A0A8H5D420_9AGAR|nr:hypothetical protein D9756_007891 [Leucoagaricus leucothites]